MEESIAHPQVAELVLGPETASMLTQMIRDMTSRLPAPATGPPAVGNVLTAEQERLAVDYEALRTALGRRDAAVSIVRYRVVVPSKPANDPTLGILIDAGHVDPGNWIVLYGAPSYAGGPHVEIGRAEYHPDASGTTWISGLEPDQPIYRLEVLHRYHGRPVRLGRRQLDDAIGPRRQS